MREIDGCRTSNRPGTCPPEPGSDRSQDRSWETVLIGDDSAALTSGLATQRIADESGSRPTGATTITRYREHWSELLARFLMSWPVRSSWWWS